MIGSMVGFGKAPMMLALEGLMVVSLAGQEGGAEVDKKGDQWCLVMKSGMELRRLEDDYKTMVVQTIDMTD
jgi:hypothetical protein